MMKVAVDAAQRLSSFALDTERLLESAATGSELLGRVVEDLLDGDKDGILGARLRASFRLSARPSRRELTSAFVAFCLCEASKRAPLGPGAPIDSSVLDALGFEASIYFRLALSGIVPKVGGAGSTRVQLIKDLERGLPPEAKAALAPVLRPKEISAPPPEAAEVERAAAVLGVGRKTSRNVVRLGEMIERLTYNPIDLVTQLQRELDSNPPSTLGRALRSFPGTADSKTDGGAIASLLALLDRFRNPKKSDRVDLELFAETFGAAGVEVAKQLQRSASLPRPRCPDYETIADTIRSLGSLLGRERALPLVDALVRKDELIPKTLPALEIAKQSVKAGHFKGRGLCAVQHAFPSLIPLLEAFVKKGMRPEDIHVLSTPYASNPMVHAYAELKGLDVQPAQDDAFGTRSFEEHRLLAITGFLAKVALLSPIPEKGWVVLDDGGLLHGLVAGKKHGISEMVDDPRVRREIARLFACHKHGVEQTTRGTTEVSGLAIDYAIIAVALALGKREEGKLIGWSTTWSLLRELRWRGAIGRVRRITVVSAGTVGIEAATRLRELGFEVAIVDSHKVKRAAAKARGFHRVAAKITKRLCEESDVILAITGRRSANGRNLRGFKGIWVSGSSAAVEGDAEHVQAFNDGIDIVNWMRPVNFARDGHELFSARQIGNTQALLFLGAAQDEAPGTTGLRPLADHPQDDMVEYWRSHGGLEVEPLSLEAKATIPRPDSLSVSGLAGHRAWMTFFRSFDGEVMPPPTSTRFAPCIYFFREPGGRVRLVDTRLGRSVELPLEEVPRRFITGRAPEFRPLHVITGPRGERKLIPLIEKEGGIELGAPRPIGAAASSRMSADGSGGFELSFAFQRGRDLEIVKGGQVEASRHIQIPEGIEPDFFVWPNDSTIYAVEKNPPRLVALRTDGGPSTGMQLPKELARIEGITELIDPSGWRDALLLGRVPGGRVLLAALRSDGTGPTLRLPRGAEFRSASKLETSNPLSPRDAYRIFYSLRGEADELEQHHSTIFLIGGDHSSFLSRSLQSS
jgi:hypothetical protein